MEWNWLQSVLYGLMSGFAEFLPVSAEAHKILFQVLTGAGNEILGFQLVCHISTLLALITCCKTQLQRIRTEQRIASVPAKRRKRQPDVRCMLDIRVLKTAAMPMLLSFLAYPFIINRTNPLWVLAGFMVINGIVLYIPQVRIRGNKDSQTMSALDSLLFGFGTALGTIPGISRLGGGVSILQLRGGDRQHALDQCLLLCIPALAVLCGFDLYFIITLSATMSFGLFLQYILAAAAAFGGTYLGIMLMRFLAVNIGFSDFSYYSWGAALLTFILYLTI